MLLNSIDLDMEMIQGDNVQWQSPQTDELLADATAHLVEAYQAIDELLRKSSLLSKSPTFMSACQGICATLLAMDEFSQLIWLEAKAPCVDGSTLGSSSLLQV
jgi:hypothetical protein